MFEKPPAGYGELGLRNSESGPLAVWRSAAVSDRDWDQFLRSTPLGQYQQSSLWAEYKTVEAWQPHRIVVTRDDAIVGGFQILWKNTRLGRIGYLSKGPVAGGDEPSLARELAILVREQVKALRLRALVAQPPDEGTQVSVALEALAFVRSNPMGIIESTLLVDLGAGIESVRSRIHRSMRQDIRVRRKGVTVREGTAADMGVFFNLMAQICARRKQDPSPSNAGALQKLWEVFSRHDSIRLSIAEFEQTPIAGCLYINFGERVTAWKKGWDNRFRSQNPNALLNDESFEWACSHHYQIYDYAAFDVTMARRMLAGDSIARTESNGRYFFLTRFGGIPKLLPKALIFISNPFLRWCYRNLVVRLDVLKLLPARLLSLAHISVETGGDQTG
jgi:hypothetical protein